MFLSSLSHPSLPNYIQIPQIVKDDIYDITKDDIISSITSFTSSKSSCMSSTSLCASSTASNLVEKLEIWDKMSCKECGLYRGNNYEGNMKEWYCKYCQSTNQIQQPIQQGENCVMRIA
jgi:hypothetical protein